ncbi:MAG TPA: DUF4173 domain-containing protein, partial [Bacteroidota bacterium]|nr:DUF4173 domain-containing protein [Bacteroidota bacterium]
IAAAGGLCALGILWRDSPVLCFLNFAAALAGIALVGMRTSSRSIGETTGFELMHGLVVHAFHACAGAGFFVAREWLPEQRGTRDNVSVVRSLVRGLAVTVPFLLLFGSLFAAADASFEHLVDRLFDFDLASLFFHLFVTGSVTWIAAGFLRGSLIAEEVPAPKTLRESFFSLGIIEVGLALGLIDALFLVFVLLQIPYLFGGTSTVNATASLTYAGYARRGFFELTAVASFTIVTLLLAEWILRKDRPRDVIVFRTLAGVNLGLLGVIMASAWQRLMLYKEAYGLTEARLYAAAALTVMGLVALWFTFSVLAGKRSRFILGSLLAVYAVILALDVINPDALIARTNIARASEGKPFDPVYMANLSADATPELMAGIERLSAHDSALLARALLRRNDAQETKDWRTWNLSRAGASAAVLENAGKLTGLSRTNQPTQ